MIYKKEDLKKYLAADAIGYKSRTSGLLPRLRNDLGVTPISDQKYIWLYIKTMRYLEYHMNKKQKPWDILFIIYYRHKLKKYSYITGYQIPPNTVDEGLTIYHRGTIIINENAHIGKNAVLRPDIVIGHKAPGLGCPKLGDNVTIDPGARIFGDITIGNNVEIAPNACVVKNFSDNLIIGGIPAKIIKHKN